jgi:hypothetical protein
MKLIYSGKIEIKLILEQVLEKGTELNNFLEKWNQK